ncbi:MAG: hypothetical protein HOC74_43915 [Gemmatimonadetes bacterium]|jgi:transcriptional regulator of heat shock response|nr:hypothetical protein [Gemmatimonadota bacterium]
MLPLLLLTALLVGLTVIAALATGRELDRKKKELAKLGQILHERMAQLEEGRNHQKIVEGNRDMLKRSSERKRAQIQQLGEELEELEQEVIAEHEIATNQPMEQKPVDFEDTPKGEGKSVEKEVKIKQRMK